MLSRLLGLLLVLTVLFPLLANAQPLNLPLSRLGYTTDIVVDGAQATFSAAFPLPAGTLLPGSVIELRLEPAPYLDDTGSFVFYLNDQPALATSVSMLRSAPRVTIPLPENALTEKALRLTIKSNVFVTNQICIDYQRGQLYYTLRNSSNLALEFTPAPVHTIPDFLRSLHAGLVIVIPDQPTEGELTAGAWAYAMLQKAFPYYPIDIIYASEREKVPEIPRLWVGTTQHLPGNLIQPGADIYLAFANAMVISGNDDATLKFNTRQLEHVLRLVALPAVAVDVSQTKAEPDSTTNIVRFGSNSAQEGILRIPMDFALYPGQLATLPKSLGIHLEGRYSVNSQPGQLVRLDVYLNRNLVHSELLDHSGQLKKDILIPNHFQLKARNMLSVELHYPQTDGLCDVKGPLQTAQLYYTSYFTGSGSFAASSHSWDSLGLTFSQNGLVILDDLAAPEAPKIAARLALFINRQLPEEKYSFPELSNLAGLEHRQPEGYLIVAGLAENLPPELQEELPIQAGIRRSAIKQNDSNILYNHEIHAQTVIGQIGIYKKTPLALFSASGSRQTLSLLLDRLNRPLSNEQLSGNILLFTAPNELSFIDSRNPQAGFPQPGILSAILDAWDKANRFVERYPKAVFLTVAVLASTVLLRIYLGHLKRKRQP